MFTRTQLLVLAIIFVVGLVCVVICARLRVKGSLTALMTHLAASFLALPVLSLWNLAWAIIEPTTRYRSTQKSAYEFSLATDPVTFWLWAIVNVAACGWAFFMAFEVYRLEKQGRKTTRRKP